MDIEANPREQIENRRHSDWVQKDVMQAAQLCDRLQLERRCVLCRLPSYQRMS